MAKTLPSEIDARVEYPIWPDDKPIPLTPLEAWYVMRGYAVRPKSRQNVAIVLEMPGQIEMSDGYVMLRQM